MPEAEVLEDLRELDFGLWEGRLAEDVERDEPGPYARWRAVDPGFVFPGGDALAATARRMAALLERLWPAAGGHAIIVAHGGVLRLGLCELIGLPWSACQRLRLDFTGITRLERHAGRVVLAGLNDTTHLDQAVLS
jgi:broad specificity phosphatase PhoE